MAPQQGQGQRQQRRGQRQQQQQADAEEEKPSMFDSILHIILLICAFQFISSSATLAYERWGGGGSNGGPGGVDGPNGIVVLPTTPELSSSSTSSSPIQPRRPAGADAVSGGGGAGAGAGPRRCLWPFGAVMDLDVVVTHDPIPPPLGGGGGRSPPPALASWHEGGLVYGASPLNGRNSTLRIPLSRELLKNETAVYAHVRLTRRRGGDVGGAEMGGGDDVDVMTKTVTLTRYRLRKKAREERSLLGDEDFHSSSGAGRIDHDAGIDNSTILGRASLDKSSDVTLLYVVPSLTLQLVTDLPPLFNRNGIPPQMVKWMDFRNRTTTAGDAGKEKGGDEKDGKKEAEMKAAAVGDDYYPVMYPSEFWIRTDSLVAINGTLEEISLDVGVDGMRMWKWQLMAQMEESWRVQDQMNGGQDGGDSDFVRTLLMDTNPWLLGVTVLVSILHSAFDFLAFKNDITFFKGKKSMEGLSLRTMVINSFFQVVIFLYLVDNDTSFMILVSNGIGLAIEFWKISKAVTFSVRDGKITWEEAATYKKSRTKEYDAIATSHLLFVTMPLVAGYGVYSLRHMKHKGWYSWILSTLVGFIYMFGFVMMTPQLFINYKMQSVAHLNHRTMTYKFLNTFVDDLFAFVIKMPIMHRLACLRDDLVYFVFLYQRWKYTTDYTRVNEYGQCAVASPADDRADDATNPRTGTEAEGVGSKNDVPAVDQTAAEGRNGQAENGIRRRRGAREKRSSPEESPDLAKAAD